MNIERKYSAGIVVTHAGGEMALTDKQLDLSVDLPDKTGAKLTEDQLSEIEGALESYEDFVAPMTNVKRVDSDHIFARLDLGGYWSPYVVGDHIEEVMEQLDDLYGIYEDYF